MPRASTVKQLPAELREIIGKLRGDGVTIDDILSKLHELGATDIKRSPLGRYVKEIDAIGERIRRDRVIAETLVQRLGDAPESRQARLNIELMHSLILQLSMAAEEDGKVTLEPKDVLFLTSSLNNLASAQKHDAGLTLRLRKEIAAENEAKLKKLEKDAATPGAASGRLDPATLKRVREEIYGITSG